MTNSKLTKALLIQMTKGVIADYSVTVADNNKVNNKELAQILREIAEELEK